MHDDSKMQLGISISRHRENQGPISLKTNHLVGVFIIWAFGVLISILAFVAEHVIHKLQCRVKNRV